MIAPAQAVVPAAPAAKILTPLVDRILQRKCDCGGAPSLTGECEECHDKRLQRKLTIGASNDPLEQEADRVADQGDAAPASVDRVLAGSGRPLEAGLSRDMESRFGYDFSQVRVHAGVEAEQSAREVNAQAYTVGRNIVFGAGRFAPRTQEGRRLVAHELAHVVQQCGSVSKPSIMQRQTVDESSEVNNVGASDSVPQDAGTNMSDEKDTTATGQTVSCTLPIPVCPSEYCNPFPTKLEAEKDRDENGESILDSIKRLNTRAEPLFRQFIFTPGPAGDISSTFSGDFTNCVVSRETTKTLLGAFEAALKANPPAYPPGGGSVTVKINSVMSAKSITDFLECRMVFDDYTSVPGLIAGGLGKTQESEKIGKNTTGAVNDSRSAAGTLTVNRNPDGSLNIIPDIIYTVVDTLDFCPGNCGGFAAQRLTVPMSRWEASAVSGDVPFKVVFPAPSLVGSYDSE